MADVTNLISKILSDYNNCDLQINSAVKYRFPYNGYYTDVFYTKEDGLSKQLLLSIQIDGTSYITTLNFYKQDNAYWMKYYICNELFRKVSHALFKIGDNYTTAPYFQAMTDYIISHEPITTSHRKELKAYKSYSFSYDEYKPYFLCTKRGHMTSIMRDKILEKYNNALACEILKVCGTTKTLVFTSDVTRSKDIEICMSNYSI